MSVLLEKIGIADVYAKTVHVLIWIGVAIATCVIVAWALTTWHGHEKYVRQTEFDRIVDEQKELGGKIDKQTDLIIKLYERR